MHQARRSSVVASLAVAAAVVAVAVALAWPAIFNGFPLLFPDGLGYLKTGHGTVAKLLGHDAPYWSYEQMRSETYAASLVFLRRGAAVWTVVAFQSLVTAWVLWLVVRATVQRRAITLYLGLGAAVALLTTAPWCIASVMPDVLGADVYFSFFLLVVVPARLRRWEAAVLMPLCVWGIAAHSAHLLLSVGLCVLFAMLLLAGWPGMRNHGRHLVRFAVLVALAVLVQLTVHKRLYGEATVLGRPPAFMMARLLGDGPARLYLQQHCAGSPWLICNYSAHLPTTEEQFLWEPDGISMTATPAQQAELRREEMPLLLATARTYPLQQGRISFGNFWQSLITMGPGDYKHYAAYTPGYLNFVAPGLYDHYAATKQIHSGLPEATWAAWQIPLMLLCLAIVLCLLPRAWREKNYPVLALTGTVLFLLPVNACLSGVISTVDPRLQGRVAWMLPVLAYLVLAQAAQQRDAARMERIAS